MRARVTSTASRQPSRFQARIKGAVRSIPSIVETNTTDHCSRKGALVWRNVKHASRIDISDNDGALPTMKEQVVNDSEGNEGERLPGGCAPGTRDRVRGGQVLHALRILRPAAVKCPQARSHTRNPPRGRSPYPGGRRRRGHSRAGARIPRGQ